MRKLQRAKKGLWGKFSSLPRSLFAFLRVVPSPTKRFDFPFPLRLRKVKFITPPRRKEKENQTDALQPKRQCRVLPFFPENSMRRMEKLFRFFADA